MKLSLILAISLFISSQALGAPPKKMPGLVIDAEQSQQQGQEQSQQQGQNQSQSQESNSNASSDSSSSSSSESHAQGGNASVNIGDTTHNFYDDDYLTIHDGNNEQHASFQGGTFQSNVYQMSLPECSSSQFTVGSVSAPVSGLCGHVYSDPRGKVGGSIGVNIPITWGLSVSRSDALDTSHKNLTKQNELLQAQLDALMAQSSAKSEQTSSVLLMEQITRQTLAENQSMSQQIQSYSETEKLLREEIDRLKPKPLVPPTTCQLCDEQKRYP